MKHQLPPLAERAPLQMSIPESISGLGVLRVGDIFTIAGVMWEDGHLINYQVTETYRGLRGKGLQVEAA